MNGSKNRVSPTEGQTRRSSMMNGEGRRRGPAGEDKNDLRDPWPCKIEALFALTAYNVNLNCVWMFPAYCFRNGGAAFFVPYMLTVILCGMPLYIMEMMFGQSGGGGLVELWHCVPLFKGIGYAGIFINFLVAIYYAVYGAWTIYYLAASFRSHLLWQDCDSRSRWATTACSVFSPNCAFDSWWNTTVCPNDVNGTIRYQYGMSAVPLRLAMSDIMVSFNDSINATSVNDSGWSNSILLQHNETMVAWRLPVHDYFENEVLRIFNTIGSRPEVGIGYEVSLCLLLVCIIIFLCLIRGAKSVGKACIVIVSLSYAFMAIVLIRTIFAFSGAAVGLKSYLFPDWTKLMDVHVWGDAASLALFTLLPTWGAVANIASHNPNGSKFREDAVIATLGCAATNVFYGLTIAMFIGILANAVGLAPVSFVTSGPQLLFVTVAQAVSQLPMAPIWSSCLYFSILNVIMGTLVIIVQTVVESITRSSISKNSARYWRLSITAAICIAIFLIGLGLVSKAGSQAVMLLDRYSNFWSIETLAFIQAIVIIFIWKHLDNRNGTTSTKWNRICQGVTIQWLIFAAVILVLIKIYIFSTSIPAHLDMKEYPKWARVIGWILSVLPLVLLPSMAAKTLVSANGDSLSQKLRNSVKPDAEWIKNHSTGIEEADVQVDRRNLLNDTETPPIVVQQASDMSDSAAVVESEPNATVAIVPLPEPAPLRIGATEPGMKAGRVNRGTQMTRDIAAQTGGEDGEGAYIEYPEHYDHPEFMGLARKHKRRKDKHRNKERHSRRSRTHESQEENDQVAPQPRVEQKVAFVDAAPAPEADNTPAASPVISEQAHLGKENDA